MNLVIITSLLNPIDKPLSYTNIRTIYSVEERYEQTLITIQSVKEQIPNSHIVLLECSQNIECYESKLEKVVDEYYNFKQDVDILTAVNSPYKGRGEVCVMLGYLKSANLTNVKSLIKLSGRYYLNNKFNFTIFENSSNIFKKVEDHSVVSTRLYKIEASYIEEFIHILERAIPYLNSGESVEHVFYKLMESNHTDILGVSGNIAVNGSLIDE